MSEDGSASSSLSSVSDWEKEVDPVTGSLFYFVEEEQSHIEDSKDAITTKKDQQIGTVEASNIQDESKLASSLPSKRRGRGSDEQEQRGLRRLAARIVRRRESKRDRGDDSESKTKTTTKRSIREATPTGTTAESDSESNSTFYRAQLKTFEAVFEKEETSELVDVYVRLQGRKNFSPSTTQLVEPMMGVEIKRFHNHDEQKNLDRTTSSAHFENVVVKGFVAHSPYKPDKVLRIGDIIRLVDGQQVSLATVDQLLSTYHSSSKVRLSLLRMPQEQNQLSALNAQSISSPSSSSISVLFFSVDSSSISFVFPSSPSSQPKWLQPLLSIQGVFSTLIHSWSDLQHSTVTESMPSSITLNVLEGCHVGLGILVENGHCLMLASSEEKDNVMAELLVRYLQRSLTFLYGSLSVAFDSADIEACLNTILGQSLKSLRQALSASQILPLPEEVRFQVDDAINQFESGDFQDESEAFFDLPREFDIIGACALYSGFLLATHLPPSDTEVVVKWLRCTGITEKCLEVAVAWKEVFELEVLEEDIERRRFLMVTGQGRMLLAAILESKASNLEPVVPPDSFYVDQAEIVLDQLEEMGVHMVCNYCLSMAANPEQLVIDDLCQASLKNDSKTSSKAKRDEEKPTLSLDQAAGILRRTRLVDTVASSISLSSNDDYNDEDGELSDNSEEMRTTFRGESLPQDSWSRAPVSLKSSSESKKPNTHEEDEDVLTITKHRLSVGVANSMLLFLHFDFGEAVLVAPLKAADKPMQAELERNFENVATAMHANFQPSRRRWERAANPQGAATAEFLEEQAVLFEWTLSSVKGRPVFNYWVAARLFLYNDDGRVSEFYVCYEDSAPQNVIEMAFRMQQDAVSL